MSARDELLAVLDGITRTEVVDAEARRILKLSAHPTVLLCRAEQIEAAYRRIAAAVRPLVRDCKHESPAPVDSKDLFDFGLALARVAGGRL